LQGAEGRNVGGIAIVFDTATQLPTMLREVLPEAQPENHFALFVENTGLVIAASAHFQPRERIAAPAGLLDPPPEGAIGFMIHDGRHYAVGSRRSAGYREFRGLGMIALTMSAVGPVREAAEGIVAPFIYSRRPVPRNEALDLATVACGKQWLALTANSIVAAIQDAKPTRVPGRAPWLLGVIRHADALVPVIDLAQLLGQKSNGTPTVVIARENGQLLGLAVDQLGDVLEVALSEIATVDAAGTGQNAGLTPGILRARAANDSTALMLDLAAVLRAAR
jgi:chemotaxis signal transduction protein